MSLSFRARFLPLTTRWSPKTLPKKKKTQRFSNCTKKEAHNFHPNHSIFLLNNKTWQVDQLSRSNNRTHDPRLADLQNTLKQPVPFPRFRAEYAVHNPDLLLIAYSPVPFPHAGYAATPFAAAYRKHHHGKHRHRQHIVSTPHNSDTIIRTIFGNTSMPQQHPQPHPQLSASCMVPSIQENLNIGDVQMFLKKQVEEIIFKDERKMMKSCCPQLLAAARKRIYCIHPVKKIVGVTRRVLKKKVRYYNRQTTICHQPGISWNKVICGGGSP